nr:MAG TPA: hypothetical protein [Caudoviricetes sp.]
MRGVYSPAYRDKGPRNILINDQVVLSFPRIPANLSKTNQWG